MAGVMAPLSSDAKWTIGTVIASVGLLATLLLSQFANINTRMGEMETRLNGRLDKVEERLLSIEEHLRAAPAVPDDSPH